MNGIIYTLATVGLAVTTLFVIGLALLIWDWADRWLSTVTEKRRLEIRQESLNSFRDRLLANSWWFSEDPNTVMVIQRLANGECVSDVRNQWRKTRGECGAGGSA
jgi:hypothetical protein